MLDRNHMIHSRTLFSPLSQRSQRVTGESTFIGQPLIAFAKWEGRGPQEAEDPLNTGRCRA